MVTAGLGWRWRGRGGRGSSCSGRPSLYVRIELPMSNSFGFFLQPSLHRHRVHTTEVDRRKHRDHVIEICCKHQINCPHNSSRVSITL